MKAKLSSYQEYIHKSRYARWIETEQRREHYDETVRRYIEFFAPRVPKADRAIAAEIEQAILNLEVMPSMRAMMTAGPALERDNCAGYNCSYIAIDDPKAFDEAMYISMCGTGVGFSVERQLIEKMPTVADQLFPANTVIEVPDSKQGWASSFRQLINLLYGGSIPTWDLSKLRPKGARLKTMGGRASGPEPLDRLFKYTVKIFTKAAGRKLNSLECHDLMCMVGTCVGLGGVRRSAMISLSNLSDDRMRNAKNGAWYPAEKQREMANNSVAYTEKPEMEIFMREMLTLVESKAGERGIFNRIAAQLSAKRTGRREWEGIWFGTNPCGEIILRPCGFCNLTEVVLRHDDTKSTIKEKVRLATILGTLQATLTEFRYLRKVWQKNAEEEALLGVSFTGIMDNEFMSTPSTELEEFLDEMRLFAVEVNKEWAAKLGIKQAAAITCVKPSGTVSQLVDSSSGIHTRYADYWLRAIREDVKGPINSLLVACGIPYEPAKSAPSDVNVFYFPCKAPGHSKTRNDLNALQQLEIYLIYKKHWTEHNPSCTIYVKDHEWLEVFAWVYKNFDFIGGISFQPYDDTVYEQTPYTEIPEEQYLKAKQALPQIDWARLPEFEKEDSTSPLKELACSGGMCELPDLFVPQSESAAAV